MPGGGGVTLKMRKKEEEGRGARRERMRYDSE